MHRHVMKMQTCYQSRLSKAPAPSSLMARARGAPATLGEKARRPAGCGEGRSRPLRLGTPGGARESLRARAPSCQPTASQPHARAPQDQAGGRLAAGPRGCRATCLAGALQGIYPGVPGDPVPPVATWLPRKPPLHGSGRNQTERDRDGNRGEGLQVGAASRVFLFLPPSSIPVPPTISGAISALFDQTWTRPGNATVGAGSAANTSERRRRRDRHVPHACTGSRAVSLRRRGSNPGTDHMRWKIPAPTAQMLVGLVPATAMTPDSIPLAASPRPISGSGSHVSMDWPGPPQPETDLTT